MSSEQENVVRVFLAIQQIMIRRGLKGCFDWMPDIAVVGEADSWEEAVSQVKALQPDVLLLDSALIEDSGIPAAAKVEAFGKEVAILLLDEETSPDYVTTLLAEVHLSDCLGITEVDKIAAAIRRLAQAKT